MKKGNCIHSVSPVHSELCEKGINFRELVGGEDFGWFMRMPCITTSGSKNQVPCKHFTPPTDKQIKEWQDETNERFVLTVCAIDMIKEVIPGVSVGVIECPKCKKSLNYRISPSTGHVWGKCSTEDCLSWVE